MKTARYGDTRLRQEYWDKITEDDTTGCWVWTGKVSFTQTPMHGAKVAWRWAYDHLIAPAPKGSRGERVCQTALCVHPDHRALYLPAHCPTCKQSLAQLQGRPKVFWDGKGRPTVDHDVRIEDDEEPAEEPSGVLVREDAPRPKKRKGSPRPTLRGKRPKVAEPEPETDELLPPRHAGQPKHKLPPVDELAHPEDFAKVDPGEKEYMPHPDLPDYPEGEERVTPRYYKRGRSGAWDWQLIDGTWVAEDELGPVQKAHAEDYSSLVNNWMLVRVSYNERFGVDTNA